MTEFGIRLPVMTPARDDRAYWRANLRLLVGLLTVWFLVGFGAGILFTDWLDRFSLFGFPLGFWIAQQGAILVFVGLIFVYVWRMNVLDRRHGVDEEEDGAD